MTPTASFTIDRKTFATAVGKVARYLPERAPAPVLYGILFEVDALGVTLTVTDLEHTARTFAAADVAAAGRFLALGKHLARIARNLPDGPVRVECDGAFVTIVGGTATFCLLTMPQQDFPDMSSVDSVAMDRVKPAAADRHERDQYKRRGLETVKMWRTPGRVSRLYEPADLQPGAWITWERSIVTRYYGPQRTMTHSDEQTETVTGQVWSAADRVRSVWAVVEGERAASLVTGYGGTLHQTEVTNIKTDEAA
jgi:hypothetical protein